MTRIVVMKDHKPLILKKDDVEDDVWICRCGLSAEWPYCDDTHKKTLKEEAAKVYQYTRRGGELVRTEASAEHGEADPRPSA